MLSNILNFFKPYWPWSETNEPVKRRRSVDTQDSADYKRVRLTPEGTENNPVLNQVETRDPFQRNTLQSIHQPYNLRDRFKPAKQLQPAGLRKGPSRIAARKTEIRNHHQSCLVRNKAAEKIKKLAMDKTTRDTVLSVADYKKLLGQLSFKNKSTNPVRKPRVVATVDLTDDEYIDLSTDHSSNKPSTSLRENEPFFCYNLSNQLSPRHGYTPRSNVTSFVDLSRDSIYDLSVHEELRTVKKYPPARKVNSLASKCLAQSPRIKSLEELDQKLQQKKADFEKELKELERNCQRRRLMSTKTISKTLDERLKQHLKITEVELVEEPGLPEMTTEMNAIVDKAFNNRRPSQEVLVTNFNYKIRRCDILTLSGLAWLNDEVINYYMELINERSRNNSKYPKVYCFGTFFYPRYASSGHSNVARWTKKVDLFSHELLLVPIHLKVHWCMASIDLKNKTIQFFDSMESGKNFDVVKDLQRYICEEYKHRTKTAFNTDGWKLSTPKDIPHQNNSCDCGIFSTTFAEYLSRRAPFNFSQQDMQYFRRKMAFEILDKRLML